MSDLVGKHEGLLEGRIFRQVDDGLDGVRRAGVAGGQLQEGRVAAETRHDVDDVAERRLGAFHHLVGERRVPTSGHVEVPAGGV